MSSAAPFCYVCKRTDRALRPYGKGGKPICLPCMTSDPTREREGQRRLAALMRKAGPEVTVGEESGPRPFNPATDRVVAVDGVPVVRPSRKV